jgi:hypothetical protein
MECIKSDPGETICENDEMVYHAAASSGEKEVKE